MSECILSDWPKTKRGYGRYDSEYHHRVIYAEACGIDLKDLDGYVIRHTCDTPPCINVEHLIHGSIEDNIQDRVDRDRSAKGENHGSAKITESDVAWIRENYPRLRQKDLAAKYGISQMQVSRIVRKLKWK